MNKSPKVYILVGIFLLATLLSFLAIKNGLRITSALVYVISIVSIASYTNLRVGLLSALTSSVIYNFFLSPPLLKFGIDSYDDVMPLIAFNTTAVFTGVLAGRLSERANAAERAQARVNALLRTSDKLQQAVTLQDVARSLESKQARLNVGRICIYDEKGHALGKGSPLGKSLLTRLTASDDYLQQRGDATYHVIRMEGNPVAIVGFIGYNPMLHGSRADLESLVNLIRLAVERCALLKQQSQIEAIRRSEELKTAILSSISHDMRTPLAAISASASSLSMLSDSLNKKVRASLFETILEQCQRLDRYTTNLLDIGRLQAGLSDVVCVPVDVLDILGAVITGARGRFPQITIRKSFSTDTLMVLANDVMVEQIFSNILDNACRYSMPNATVHLTTRVERNLGFITISDNGPGIAPDDLPHLFERFFRGSRTRHLAGTGLGLAIARGFVEEFHGVLQVHSPAIGQPANQEHPGTTVCVQFPLIDISGCADDPENPDR